MREFFKENKNNLILKIIFLIFIMAIISVVSLVISVFQSISPVVFGIKKSTAEKLGLVNGNVSNSNILNLIKENKIKYVMPSVTQTNTGATAYLGFLSSLAGNP